MTLQRALALLSGRKVTVKRCESCLVTGGDTDLVLRFREEADGTVELTVGSFRLLA